MVGKRKVQDWVLSAQEGFGRKWKAEYVRFLRVDRMLAAYHKREEFDAVVLQGLYWIHEIKVPWNRSIQERVVIRQ